MTGSFCTSCGAPVAGMRFCTSCGARVAPAEPDPYDYLYEEPRAATAGHEAHEAYEPPVFAPQAPQVWQAPPPPGPPPGPPLGRGPRRSSGWPWAVAAALVLAVVVAGGVVLLTSDNHGDTPSGEPAARPPATSAPTPTQPAGGASTPAPTRTSGGPQSAATVATRVRALLAAEVAAHRIDNAAVGAVATCTHVAANRRTIEGFVRTRQQLAAQLAAVPASDDRQLDTVVHRLLATWRELVPVDRAYATWATTAHRAGGRCRVGAIPTTSPASKAERKAVRDAWSQVLAHHPEWGVAPVVALRDSRANALAYLLL